MAVTAVTAVTAVMAVTAVTAVTAMGMKKWKPGGLERVMKRMRNGEEAMNLMFHTYC